MDQRRFYFHAAQASRPQFCSHCGAGQPQLAANEQAKYRFCSGCGTEVQWRPQRRTDLTIDQRGSIVPGPAKIIAEKPFLSVQNCLSYLDAHPSQLVVVGGATVVLGGGLGLVAAPVAALAAAVVAGGVTILKVSVVGGVLTAVCAACSKDAPVGSMLKGVGIVALAGITTIAAGGILGFIAGLCGLLGGVLMTCGGIAVAAIAASQLYLHHQARQERIGIDKNLETAEESLSLSRELLREFFPN